MYQPQSKYTRELFGVEYLFRQLGIVLNMQGEELNKQIDEGFEDVKNGEDIDGTAVSDHDHHGTAVCLLEESDCDEKETKEVYLIP